MLFACLEDEFGLTDVVLFEPVYQAYGHWMLTQPMVVAEGCLQRRGRGVSLIVYRVTPYRLANSTLPSEHTSLDYVHSATNI